MKPNKRFWDHVDKNGPVPAARSDLGPCWLWTAYTEDGYGRVKVEGRIHGAHRISWEMQNGPIPAGLVMDHLCRVRSCVNPAHLEPVTNVENLHRGETINAANARKTHCPKGHPYDGANTYISVAGWRDCRICRRDAAARHYQKSLGKPETVLMTP